MEDNDGFHCHSNVAATRVFSEDITYSTAERDAFPVLPAIVLSANTVHRQKTVTCFKFKQSFQN